MSALVEPTLEKTLITSGCFLSRFSTFSVRSEDWSNVFWGSPSSLITNSPLSPSFINAAPINPNFRRTTETSKRAKTPPYTHLRCCKAQRRMDSYLHNSALKDPSNQMAKRPIRRFRVSFSILLNWEANSGVTVKETNKLIKVENTITSENSRNMCPIIPDTNESGRKTTTSTNVIARAVSPISFLPSRAATVRFFPISRWRWIFSRTTMESSTRMPITRESAIRVSMFNEKSKTYMAIKTETIEQGIETRIMNELRTL